MACSYRHTVRRMVDDTLRLCGDFRGSGKDGRVWTWAEVRDAVRETVVDFARDSWVLKDFAVIPLMDGVGEYDLPSDCTAVIGWMLNGITGGTLLFPTALSVMDYGGITRSSSGSPGYVYRDSLPYNTFGVTPIPGSDGSTWDGGDDEVLVASVEDEDGELLPYESEDALVGIDGGGFVLSGSGAVVSEVRSLYGNVLLVYVRDPEFPVSPDGYIDDSIPYRVHKDVKYGAAAKLLGFGDVYHSVKAEYFGTKWQGVVANARVSAERRGNVLEVMPV